MSPRLGIRIDFLAADYKDFSQSSLGHENQGRIGWLIVGLAGALNDRVSYLFEINPADDSATPLPACGEDGFFYPNVPDGIGPRVECSPDGRNRVDLYRFVGLDPLIQQGSMRQAFVDLHAASRHVGLRLGRFLVPFGFRWDEAGSWTNLDATFIQRLNADANFGVDLYTQVRRSGRPFAELHLVGVRGDGSRAREYSYSGFVALAEDTNSALTGVLAGRVYFGNQVELRAAGRYGLSGSRVERYPSFFISKRNDQAIVLSAQYRPFVAVRFFGEYAWYRSGLPASSAQLLSLPPRRVAKPGGYLGMEVVHPISAHLTLGAVVTSEAISRNDSLVWYLAERGLYRARLGAWVRSTVVRAYLIFGGHFTFGVFRHDLVNPFPWLSGIAPIAGPRAFEHRGDDKYGFVMRLKVP